MSERRPYSRVYWSVQDDPKFDGIREDMRHMGSWTTLLVLADQAWPAPCYPPPIVPKSSLRALIEAGLVDEMSGGRIRIHGLDTERNARRDAATREPKRDPVGSQAGPKRDPVGSQAEQSKAEDEQSKAEAPRDPADIYYQLTAKFPKDAALKWVDEMTAKYGAEPTIRALVMAHRQDRSVATLLGRTQDVLAGDARKLSLKDREAETARLAELRAKPRKVEPWREEQRRALEERYGDYEVYRPGDAA